MRDDGYPETVSEILDDGMAFRQGTLWAMRRFAESRPWSSKRSERKEKFRRLNRELASAYQIREPELEFGQLDGGSSGGSHYSPLSHRIVLVGRLSVVTYLHEFAHARGMGEREACRWSVNLFRRCFPRQFSRLIQRGHMLLRPLDAAARSRGGTDR